MLTLGNSLGLLDDLLTLGQDELDVAGVGHIGVDLWIGLDANFKSDHWENIHDRGHGMSFVAAWGPG